MSAGFLTWVAMQCAVARPSRLLPAKTCPTIAIPSPADGPAGGTSIGAKATIFVVRFRTWVVDLVGLADDSAMAETGPMTAAAAATAAAAERPAISVRIEQLLHIVAVIASVPARPAGSLP